MNRRHAPRNRDEVFGILCLLPVEVRARCGFLVALDALAAFEREHPRDTRPREALAIAAREMRGETVTRGEFADAVEQAAAARPADGPLRDAGNAILDFVKAASMGFGEDGVDYLCDAIGFPHAWGHVADQQPALAAPLPGVAPRVADQVATSRRD